MPIAYVKSSISSTQSSRNPTKCWGISFIVSSIFGAIFIIGGLAILMSMPYVIENLIRTEHNLADGTSLYKKWVDPEYIIDLNIWTHSIQNPDNITIGMKPRVVNKGPYVFDERQYKKILSKGNGTIKYQNYMTYFYNEQKSCQNCSLANDHVWIPNLVYQKFVLAASNPLTKVASTALQLQTPFLDVKTKELFFVGYVDPFLDQICSLPFMNIICESMLNMPDRIGLLYERNGTHEGDYLVSDGTHDRSKSLGKIIAWNGRKTVPSSWWSTTQASMINGTDGGLVHPYVTKDERIYIFSTFICRSIYLTFQKEFDYEGVNAYKFGVPKDAWNYEKPEHTGYCHKTTKVYFDHQTPGCLPNGLMDLSRCLKGKLLNKIKNLIIKINWNI